jgi:hypothetical protein
MRYSKRGGVAEWTKAAALKAVEGPVPSVGSNPTPSAKHCTRPPRARRFTHPDPGAPRRAAVPWDGRFSRGLARAGPSIKEAGKTFRNFILSCLHVTH